MSLGGGTIVALHPYRGFQKALFQVASTEPMTDKRSWWDFHAIYSLICHSKVILFMVLLVPIQPCPKAEACILYSEHPKSGSNPHCSHYLSSPIANYSHGTA